MLVAHSRTRLSLIHPANCAAARRPAPHPREHRRRRPRHLRAGQPGAGKRSLRISGQRQALQPRHHRGHKRTAAAPRRHRGPPAHRGLRPHPVHLARMEGVRPAHRGGNGIEFAVAVHDSDTVTATCIAQGVVVPTGADRGAWSTGARRLPTGYPPPPSSDANWCPTGGSSFTSTSTRSLGGHCGWTSSTSRRR
jgi:hypothetical protein